MIDYEELPIYGVFTKEQLWKAFEDMAAFLDASFGCYPESEIQTDDDIIDVIPQIMALILNRGIDAVQYHDCDHLEGGGV